MVRGLRKGSKGGYFVNTTKGRDYQKPQTAARKIQAAARRARKAPVRQVVKNTKSIITLKGQANGHVQRSYQHIKFVNVPGSFALTPTTPLIINAINFLDSRTAGGSVYYPIYTGTTPNIVPSPAVAGKWTTYSPSDSQGFTVPYQMWKDQNIDTMSASCYQPLFASYKFNFNIATMPTQQADIWIRIDHFKTRRLYLNSDYHRYTMPDAVGCLSNMAVNNQTGKRNAFNPALFHVKKTRYVKIPAVDTQKTDHNKTLTVSMGFPKKLVKLDLDATSPTVVEPYYLNADPRQNEWLLVSCSAHTPPIELTLTRKIVWRDQHGIQM